MILVFVILFLFFLVFVMFVAGNTVTGCLLTDGKAEKGIIPDPGEAGGIGFGLEEGVLHRVANFLDLMLLMIVIFVLVMILVVMIVVLVFLHGAQQGGFGKAGNVIVSEVTRRGRQGQDKWPRREPRLPREFGALIHAVVGREAIK